MKVVMRAEDIFLNAMKNVKPTKIVEFELNQKKQDDIFVTIDLHAKTLKEALSLVVYNVERVSKEGIRLKIITGKGKNSTTVAPLLAREVKNYLLEKGLKFKEREGFFEVW